jgi:argonaute-like protein implicated in RNA metabolism and viral defense
LENQITDYQKAAESAEIDFENKLKQVTERAQRLAREYAKTVEEASKQQNADSTDSDISSSNPQYADDMSSGIKTKKKTKRSHKRKAHSKEQKSSIRVPIHLHRHQTTTVFSQTTIFYYFAHIIMMNLGQKTYFQQRSVYYECNYS